MAKAKTTKTTKTTTKAAKTTTSKITRKKFPKNELDEWLSERSFWNHDDWNCLLENLRDKGYTQWTENQTGREEIGMYLENTRSDWHS